MPGYDCVVLAGGSGTRLGGVDKGGLVVDGASLLDRVLAATAGSRRTVVVGAPRPTARAVEWTREDPPGGGPVAGLAAGLAHLEDGDLPLVVLATDLPRITAPDVDRLLAGLARDAVLFVDAEGHRQPLAAAYRRAPLRKALRALEPVTGKAVRELVARLAIDTIPDHGAAADVDTPEDLTDVMRDR